MGRQRSPDRARAEKMYLEAMGEIKLRDIAEAIGLPEGTIRGWKLKDSWDKQLKGTERNAPKNMERSEKSQRNAKPKERISNEVLEELDNPDMTEKQMRFCMHYVKNFNATTAAIKAGYSPASAHVIGCRLLRMDKIRAYIRQLKGTLTEDLLLDAKDVIAKYMQIAFSDITDFVEFGQEEVPVIGMYGPVEVKNDEGKKEILTEMVNKVRFKEAQEVDGGLICEISQGKQGTKIKLEDRMKALDKIAVYCDMFPDKFKRRIEEEKLALMKRRYDEDDTEETDDGFINALSGEVKVWDEED